MLNERNPYGHWRSTWANGWSLAAIGLYDSFLLPRDAGALVSKHRPRRATLSPRS